MRYSIATLLLAVALPLLGGCGQMGPLYLPPPEAAQPAKPAEQAEQAHSSPQTSSAP